MTTTTPMSPSPSQDTSAKTSRSRWRCWLCASLAGLVTVAFGATAAAGGSLHFEPNQGQSPAAVRYTSRGGNQSLVVTERSLWLRTQAQPLVGLEFEGGATLDPVGLDKLEGVSHYRVGSDPGLWQSNVPHFARLAVPAVYPGVDVIAYAHGGDLEYDLIVAPGADPARIRLRFTNATRVALDAAGDLVIDTPSGQVTQERPFAYQTITGGADSSAKRRVKAHYRLLSDGSVAIALGRYDRRRTLVIDPVLSTTRRHGGSGNEQLTDIAADGAGNVYAVGYSEGSGFPTLNAAQSTMRGEVDAFVSKFNSSGTLVYSTFFGGNSDDVARAIALDGGGRAYVVGVTKSTNLSIVRGFQTASPPGANRSFLLVLSSGGNVVDYSSYLGGSSSDADVQAWDVATAADGMMWVTGHTTATTFPFAATGFQTTHGGGKLDAFVLRVNPAASGAGSVAGFTYYGGDSDDVGRKLLRRTSDFLVAGESMSTNLRVLRTFGTNLQNNDAFVLATPAALTYGGAFRLGGIGDDTASGLQVDGSGNIYLAGNTTGDLPVTGLVSQRTHADLVENTGRADAYVAKFDWNANNLVYLTYLGGVGEEIVNDLAVTRSGIAYVSGTSFARNFPVTPSAIQTSAPDPRNGFLTKLNATGARVYSTYLGGSLADDAVAVTASNATVWVGATSESDTFPGATNTLGNWDGLLTKLTASALFVVGSTTLTAADTAIRNRLQGLGFNVTIKTGAAATSADANAKDLVLISATVASADVNTKFKRSAVGVINLEDALQDDLALTSTNSSDFGRTTVGQTQVTMLTSTDPLSAGLSGNQTVVSSGRNFVWGRPNGNAIKVATLLGDATRFSIYRYEAGATLFGTNTDGTPFLAPDRRVSFFAWEDAATALNTNGWNLFDAAVRWAAGW